MRYSAGILLLLLLSSGALAQSNQREFNDAHWGIGAAGSTELYLVDGFTDVSPSSFTRDVFSVRLDTRDRISNGTWVVIIAVAYSMVQNSNGVWQWQAGIDGVDIPGCLWQIQTINSAAGLTGATTIAHPNMQIVCRVEEPSYGSHSFTITRSTVTGSPATIDRATTSVNILNNDPVILSMPSNFESLTGLTAIEFLIFPALAFVGLFLWSRQDIGVRLFGISLVLFDWALVFAFYASASGEAWRGLLVLLVLLLPMAGWLVVKLALEIAQERQVAA